MALSDSERETFAALEAQLKESDPEFVRKVSARSLQNGQYNSRKIILGTLIFVAGIIALLFGITADILLVGVLGFVLMGAGVYLALTKVAGNAQTPQRVTSSTGKPTSAFMKRLEDEWEERLRREGR